jgi:hypothetical protein
MENTIDWVDTILQQAVALLGKLYGLPGGLLVLVSCLTVGYALRMWKWFPNQGIPVVVVLWGPVFNMLIADPLADTFPIRIWLVKNFLVGVVIGGAAWLIHNKVLKRLEDKLPFLKGWLVPADDTGIYNKRDFPDGKPSTETKETKQ